MQSTTVKVPFSLPDQKVLDIEIVVYYRPAWYPFKRRDAFRFITKVAPDGQIYWVRRPASSPYPGSEMLNINDVLSATSNTLTRLTKRANYEW